MVLIVQEHKNIGEQQLLNIYMSTRYWNPRDFVLVWIFYNNLVPWEFNIVHDKIK